MLTCIVHFTSFIVTTPNVAPSRIPSVVVKQPATSVYVGAWFLYNGIVQQVVTISEDVVGSKEPDEDDNVQLLQLSLATIANLINSFGR